MRKPPLPLDMPTIVRATRAALDAGELQILRDRRSLTPRYAGPCAIGLAMSPEDRRRLDRHNTPVDDLDARKFVFFPTHQQLLDARELQDAHDTLYSHMVEARTAHGWEDAIQDARLTFDAALSKFEGRYLGEEKSAGNPNTD